LFEIVPLFMEPQVIALATDHPLTGSTGLSVQALLGLECVDPDGLSPDMRGYGPTLGSRVPVEEQLEKVALGVGYAVLPSGIAGFCHRPDVSYLQAAGLDEMGTEAGGFTLAGSFSADAVIGRWLTAAMPVWAADRPPA
jgi:DNA-binding transcriptional LysR family regulator